MVSFSGGTGGTPMGLVGSAVPGRADPGIGLPFYCVLGFYLRPLPAAISHVPEQAGVADGAVDGDPGDRVHM